MIMIITIYQGNTQEKQPRRLPRLPQWTLRHWSSGFRNCRYLNRKWCKT